MATLLPCVQSAEGAHLSWEPPANSAGAITEYSVYLGLKPQPGAQPGTMAFARVYCGPASQCVVSHAQLANAHIDTTSKPAIIFRIAAKNDKGWVYRHTHTVCSLLLLPLPSPSPPLPPQVRPCYSSEMVAGCPPCRHKDPSQETPSQCSHTRVRVRVGWG